MNKFENNEIKDFKHSNKFEYCINQTKNDKPRFILKLLYQLRLSTGMIINLKVKDIRDNILYCRGRRIWIPDILSYP